MAETNFAIIRINGTLPDPSQVDSSGIPKELWEPYVDSTESFLAELENAAMELETGNNTEDNSAIIRRVLHSLKGEAGMCGLMDVNNLCHEAEFAFDDLTEISEAADMVLKVKDWIEAAIKQISA